MLSAQICTFFFLRRELSCFHSVLFFCSLRHRREQNFCPGWWSSPEYWDLPYNATKNFWQFLGAVFCPHQSAVTAGTHFIIPQIIFGDVRAILPASLMSMLMCLRWSCVQEIDWWPDKHSSNTFLPLAFKFVLSVHTHLWLAYLSLPYCISILWWIVANKNLTTVHWLKRCACRQTSGHVYTITNAKWLSTAIASTTCQGQKSTTP